MADDIVRQLEAIDLRRTALLDELDALDPAWLVARPIEGKWTILEIVEHLVLAESATLGAMDDPAAPALARPGLKDRLMYRVVMFVLGSSFLKVRVPSRRMLPQGERTLAELRATWDGNHSRFREIARTLDAAGARRPVVRHAVAGPMSLAKAVDMLDVHLHRHARQIRERRALLEAAGASPRPPTKPDAIR